MPIYTKTGDRGTTGLYGGKRVKKYDQQIETYGSVDELSSFIGLVISKLKNKKHKLFLTYIQKDLYSMMGLLCGAKVDLKSLEKNVIEFEKQIDEFDKKLPKLTRFVLPQGSEISSLFHILRVTCRKAERNIVNYSDHSNTTSNMPVVIKYINRLSDLFFTFARFYAKGREVVT